MKVFFGLTVLMGIVKKPTFESYWSEQECIETPFFRKYMSRNRFQNILTHLHFEPAESRPKGKLRPEIPLKKARAKPKAKPVPIPTRKGRKKQPEPETETEPKPQTSRGRGRGGGRGRGRGRGRLQKVDPESEYEPESESAESDPELEPESVDVTRPDLVPSPPPPPPPPRNPDDPHRIGPADKRDKQPVYDYDKLFKIRPLIDMVTQNFQKYVMQKNIALDEGGCPFKGRLGIKQYNPAKPNKYSIKTYQLCESSSGYCAYFEIYTGNAKEDGEKPQGVTFQLVQDMIRLAQCADQGYHLYMDNYYNSPDLCVALGKMRTMVCGTVNMTRKNVPLYLAAIRKYLDSTGDAKIEHRGKITYRRKGDVLLQIWKDKRCVSTISTIHKAMMRNEKVHYFGHMVQKPVMVLDYTAFMYGVDLCDQRLSYYNFLRKSIKWWRKMAFHIWNICMLNADILYKKYSSKKLNPIQFRLKVALALLKQGAVVSNSTPVHRAPLKIADAEDRIVPDGHYPSRRQNAKGTRSRASACKVCKLQLVPGTDKYVRRDSVYWCAKCKVHLCMIPSLEDKERPTCFEIYHTQRVLTKEVYCGPQLGPQLPKKLAPRQLQMVDPDPPLEMVDRFDD